MKDFLLRARVVVRTSNVKISPRRLADYDKASLQKACRTCSTIVFLHSTNQIIDLWRCRWRCRRQILNFLITSYPTRANRIIVLVNSQTGFCRRFLFPPFYKGSGKSIQRLDTRTPTLAITWLLHNKKLNVLIWLTGVWMCPLAACRTGVGYRSIEAFKCYYGSLLTPSFRRSTAVSGRKIKYLRYDFTARSALPFPPNKDFWHFSDTFWLRGGIFQTVWNLRANETWDYRDVLEQP